MIKIDQFIKLFPNAKTPAAWVEALNKKLERAGI